MRFHANAGNERLRITSDGKIGIGTASPSKTLTVRASDCRLRLEDSDVSTSVEVQNNSGDAVLTTNGATNLRLQTNNTERLRITSAGKVGIGTTSPNRILSVKGNGGQMSIVDDDDSMMQFYCNSGTGSIWATGGGGTDGSLDFATTPNGGSIASRMQISASGNVTLNTGNLVIGTAGKGIDFSATSNASGMTSEVLDDYEIGAWTPLIATTGTNFTSISNSSSGHYTKVGNVVTLTMYHRTDGITKGSASNSDHVIITGLPFTPSSNIQRCFVPIGFNPNWAEYPNQALIKESSTNIELYKYASAGGYNTGTRLTVAAVGTGGNANYCLVTMVYRT